MEFTTFRILVKETLDVFQKDSMLYRLDVNPDELWEKYLDSFPNGTNEIYRERRYYDCSACRYFIKNIGGIVRINKDLEIISIWDTVKHAPYPFDVVSEKLSEYLKNFKISTKFVHFQKNLGIRSNKEISADGKVITWDHFYTVLNPKFVKDKSEESISRENFELIKRTLEELSEESLEICLELMAQNSLYRGNEHQPMVENALELLKQYNKIPDNRKDIFIWKILSESPNLILRIKNSVIGTLLKDIPNGLNEAVTKYENLVAPENYKRPKPLITKSMIKQAEQKLKDLDLDDKLEFRHCDLSDIPMENRLFINQNIKKEKTIFDNLENQISNKSKSKQFDNVTTVSISKFIEDILPKLNSLEVFVENKHESNFVTLLKNKVDKENKLFYWKNPISWVYNGNYADSIIKKKVKSKGGITDAFIRLSLHWFNTDDLDLHAFEPNKFEIYYGNKKSPSSGYLDIDMNVNGYSARCGAVENIVWTNPNNMQSGEYTISVHNYTKRNSVDVGFEIEMEYNGETKLYKYLKPIDEKKFVKVLKFKYDSSTKQITNITEFISSEPINKRIYEIKTGEFHPVNLVCLSPNWWDYNKGNKHYLFIIKDCKTDNKIRPFFNEYLSEKFRPHRKVFEILGDKLKVDPEPDQLSGLGFSETKKNNLIAKCKGSFNRIIKIVI